MSKKYKKQYFDSEAMPKFRESFWKKCKEKGIVLEDLADRTGIDYAQIYRIVRGTRNTSFSNIIAVIRAAELQPADILNFEIEIPKYPPLRNQLSENEIKTRKTRSRGATFFLREFINEGHFENASFTVSEITRHFNEDLSAEFSEAEFSTALYRLFQNEKLDRFKNKDGVWEYQLKNSSDSQDLYS